MSKLFPITATVIAAMGVMNLARIDRTNLNVDSAQGIEAYSVLPEKVTAILGRACRNCHSERTEWPWYSAVAPFQWLMTADVYAARAHMNLSTWGRYTPEERTGRLIAICEMVAGNKMPPWYYRPMNYPSAWLSDVDKAAVCDWVKAEVQKSALTQDFNSENGEREE
jgi:hypothetical protein